MSSLLVACAVGVVAIDPQDEEVTLLDEELPDREEPEGLGLPLLVAADRVGSRILAVVARRPPLLISNDAGITWRELGGGLAAGVDVAIDPDSPDTIAYGTESRIYLSQSGGVFWEALETELPDISGLRWAL